MNGNEDVLRTTLDVEHNGETYTFAIPGFQTELQLGVRERDIRREYDPVSYGSPAGLDQTTYEMFRSAAVFEVLLRAATNRWPYTADKDGKPVIDHKKFPDDRVEEVMEIGLKFQASLSEFRAKRNSDRLKDRPKTVAGQPDSPDVTVQPGSASP